MCTWFLSVLLLSLIIRATDFTVLFVFFAFASLVVSGHTYLTVELMIREHGHSVRVKGELVTIKGLLIEIICQTHALL